MAENDTQELFNTKEGPLAKTGSNNKGWKDRYFRLKDGKLNYYKSEKDKTVLGYIDLRDCIKVTKEQGKKGNGFDIHTPGRVYNLSTRTEDETAEWIEAVDVSVAISNSVYGERRSGSILERGRQRNDSYSSIDQDQVSFTSQDNVSNRKSEPDFHSLLEAEVKALNTRSSQFEEELRTTQSQRNKLHDKLQVMKTDHDDIVKQNEEDVTVLKNQIQSLEKTKSNLETVNDSLRVQVQEREESMINLEQQLTEEIRELEEETRNLQEDLERLKEKQLEVNEQNESFSQSNTDLQGTLRQAQIDFEEKRKEHKLENNKLLETIEQLQKEVETEQKNHKQERTQRQKAEEQLKLSMEMCHKLEVTERERDRLKALLTSLQQNQQSDSTTTLEELKSERLQLQVELENLRNSMNRKMESVRGACEKETNELKQKMEILEQERNQMTKSIETKNSTLATNSSLVTELQNQVQTLEDGNNLLKIEKEKAMSDLIAIKKNMKERERKHNSDDENTNPNSNRDSKLLEAENRAEMATRLLKEIQAERDLLKTQVRKYGSPIKPTVNGTPDPVDNNNSDHVVGIPSDFKTKSQPTTAVSNFEDLPPPKPKRPTRDILDKLKF